MLIDGTAGDDTLNGTVSNDIINGLAGNDYIDADNGDDTINGGDGEDIIVGGAGADIIDGGNGNYDNAFYISSVAGVNVNLNLITAQSGGHAQGDILSNIENVSGSNFNDTLIGNSGGNYLNGNDGDDYVDGGSGDDNLNGDAGDDTIYAGDGNDLMSGGAGADIIDGGTGTYDILYYSNASSGVNVDLSLAGAQVGGDDSDGDIISNIEGVFGTFYDDVIIGDDGDNFIEGFDGADIIDGGAGVDWVYYYNSSSGINLNLTLATAQSGGHAQGDIVSNIENVIGSFYDDVIIGNSGSNSIVGGVGADIIDGGAGDDKVFYYSSGAGVNVNLSLVTAQSGGDAQGDIISNMEGVIGSYYDDVITGNSADNYIDGLGGADNINGGSGIDTVAYNNSFAGINVNLNSATAQSGGDAQGDILSNIENIFGSFYDDTITSSVVANNINGSGGNDTVSYAGSASLVNVSLARTTAQFGGSATGDILSNIENLIGSFSNDVLTGNSSSNNIVGGNGNDAINGGVGNDTVTGGAGVDVFTINKDAGSTDIITDFSTSTVGERISLLGFVSPVNFASLAISQVGADAVVTLENAQTLILQNVLASSLTAASFGGSSSIINGTAGNDTLNGTAIADTINGLGGNDSISGLAGDDTINGGDGNDTINGGLGADTISGAAGIDTASYANSAYLVNVSLARTGIQYGGDAINDVLSGIENLIGSFSNDVLVGNTVANNINGGAGNDTITGAAGVDVLTGGLGADKFRYTSTTDSGIAAGLRDMIADFSSAQADKVDLSAFAGTFNFNGTGAFTGTAQEVNYSQAAGNTIIGVDTNGNGILDFQIELAGLHTLAAGDFVL